MATQLDVIKSLHNLIVFDSKDYSLSPRDAWIYGIICGWDGPSMKSLASKFRWNDDTVERLRALRKCWRDTESKLERAKAKTSKEKLPDGQ